MMIACNIKCLYIQSCSVLLHPVSVQIIRSGKKINESVEKQLLIQHTVKPHRQILVLAAVSCFTLGMAIPSLMSKLLLLVVHLIRPSSSMERKKKFEMLGQVEVGIRN